MPLDLAKDLSADEDGKAVHDLCYLNRIVASLRAQPSFSPGH
jgi:hypothetical protein